MQYYVLNELMLELKSDIKEAGDHFLVSWIAGEELHCLYKDTASTTGPREQPPTYHACFTIEDNKLHQIYRKIVITSNWNS